MTTVHGLLATQLSGARIERLEHPDGVTKRIGDGCAVVQRHRGTKLAVGFGDQQAAGYTANGADTQFALMRANP